MVKKRILLVTSDKETEEKINATLPDDEYSIITAPDEEQAIRFVKELLDERIECIIIDHHLKKIDGVGLIIYFRKILRFKNHPLILLLDKINIQTIEDAIEAGCHYYIKKDFEPNELIATIKSSIHLYEHISEIAYQANYDKLTGLYNRHSFWRFFEQEFAEAERYGKIFSLCMLDLDDFKQINDSYGHMMGDVVLSESSKTLLAKLRNSDIAGRFGGEEFIIIYTETDETHAKLGAERIRTGIKKLKFEFIDKQITVSIGITQFTPDKHKTIETLVIEADNALYYSKKHGKNRITLYSEIAR